jgi:hypothetical protein
MRSSLILATALACLACTACSGSPGTGPGPFTPPPTDNVLVGAGDICGYGPVSGPESTATLLDTIPGTIFTTGDNVNTVATLDAFMTFFEPTWGRHRSRIRPCPGNHDYEVAGAAGYFDYFGSNAGPAGRGYYSYNIGSWHVVSLDSEIPMNTGSLQASWLNADLAANPTACTIAYWHEPLFSSNTSTENPAVADFWSLLYQTGAEIVLNGHNHVYERFAPMDPNGHGDPRGIREFIVGTGGATLYPTGTPRPLSEATASVHGVLKLTLKDGSYDWEFIPVAGQTFRDSGSGTCH